MDVDSDNDLLSKTAAGELVESYVAPHRTSSIQQSQPDGSCDCAFANLAFFFSYREAWPALRDEIISRLDKVRF